MGKTCNDSEVEAKVISDIKCETGNCWITFGKSWECRMGPKPLSNLSGDEKWIVSQETWQTGLQRKVETVPTKVLILMWLH